jgi:hypothetical protein
MKVVFVSVKVYYNEISYTYCFYDDSEYRVIQPVL